MFILSLASDSRFSLLCKSYNIISIKRFFPDVNHDIKVREATCDQIAFSFHIIMCWGKQKSY